MSSPEDSHKGDPSAPAAQAPLALPWTGWLRGSLLAIENRLAGVPVRIKISGMVLLPLLNLGLAIAIWVRTSVSDWPSWLLESEFVGPAIRDPEGSILLVTGLAAIFSVLLSSFFLMVLTHPILELKRVADKVRGGELDHRAKVRSNDEIGQVAESFNHMLDELVQSQRELERSNRRLGALCHVATAVGHGLELGHVLRAALSSTLDVAGLQCGWLYLQEPDSGWFFLASAVNAPDAISARSWSRGGEFCACQQALMERADWVGPEQRECGRLTHTDLARETGASNHLSIPLRARGMNLGVLNLLGSKDTPPGDEKIDLLDALGAQVSEAVANARLHADLKAKEAGMETLLHSLDAAQEAERSRISRELHDGAGQELTSVLLRLKSLESKSDIDVLRLGISDLCIDLSQAIGHIRTLSHQLRPPALEQLGLGPTLRNLTVDMLGTAGMTLDIRLDLDGHRLDPSVEISLYRIVQEALTNIARHADASAAGLSLQFTSDDLLLEVEDDGRGFDPNLVSTSGTSHIGLAGIQERTERLGGSFAVESAPDRGTRLVIRIPRTEVSA